MRFLTTSILAIYLDRLQTHYYSTTTYNSRSVTLQINALICAIAPCSQFKESRNICKCYEALIDDEFHRGEALTEALNLRCTLYPVYYARAVI